MVHPGIHDGFAGLDQIVHVVHEIEVTVDGGAVFLHQPRLHLQCLEPLGGQGNAGYRAGEDLQVGVRADRLAHLVHAGEGILAGIEVGRLIAGAAAKLEMAHAHGGGGLHGGQHILDAYLAAEHALQSVAEGGQHDMDFFWSGCKDHDGSRCLTDFFDVGDARTGRRGVHGGGDGDGDGRVGPRLPGAGLRR